MNANDILKQKLLDTEEDHTTGITREEVMCIQSKLESLHSELVEAVNNQTSSDLYYARMALAYIRDKAEAATVTRVHLKNIAESGIVKSGGPITIKEVMSDPAFADKP